MASNGQMFARLAVAHSIEAAHYWKMSKSQRDKGLRAEREIVQLHRNIGVHAERVPLSGASKYRGNGADVDIYVSGREEAPLVAEIKARGDGKGFMMLERWLNEYDVLFLRRNNAKPLVVLPWRVYEYMVRKLSNNERISTSDDDNDVVGPLDLRG